MISHGTLKMTLLDSSFLVPDITLKIEWGHPKGRQMQVE